MFGINNNKKDGMIFAGMEDTGISNENDITLPSKEDQKELLNLSSNVVAICEMEKVLCDISTCHVPPAIGKYLKKFYAYRRNKLIDKIKKIVNKYR